MSFEIQREKLVFGRRTGETGWWGGRQGDTLINPYKVFLFPRVFIGLSQKIDSLKKDISYSEQQSHLLLSLSFNIQHGPSYYTLRIAFLDEFYKHFHFFLQMTTLLLEPCFLSIRYAQSFAEVCKNCLLTVYKLHIKA